MVSPKPVPVVLAGFPVFLVEKKGSKTCFKRWGGIPLPLSERERLMYFPFLRAKGLSSSRLMYWAEREIASGALSGPGPAS